MTTPPEESTFEKLAKLNPEERVLLEAQADARVREVEEKIRQLQVIIDTIDQAYESRQPEFIGEYKGAKTYVVVERT